MDISVQELKTKIDNKEDFVFLDVREPHEYEEQNLGATLIPLGDVLAKISDFEDFKNKEVIIHCRSGARSGMAQQLFQAEGFTNVRNVLGGILAWNEM